MRPAAVLVVALLSLGPALGGCAENAQDSRPPRSQNPQIPRTTSGPTDMGPPPRELIGGKGHVDTLPKGKQP